MVFVKIRSKREEFMNHEMRLLYIEDDKEIQAIYLDSIQELVDQVHVAYDGEEGYECYLRIKPDIILLDINMPKLDGLSLAAKIRQLDSDVKIIVTSAHGEQDKLLQAIELYLIKYILKPLDPLLLKDAILKAKNEVLMSREAQTPKEKLFYLDEHTTWNVDSEKLYSEESEIKLTKNERRLLKLLSSKENKVFTFFEIFDYISHDNFDKEYDAGQVRALVKLLRKKIPKDAVLNVYGEGYRFNPLKPDALKVSHKV
ncbi:MAG TPA: response regulator transcription factor [Campylobacterales bacterium]|nr:response regulator transcription factor [Campylobacterales bacterium]